MNRFFITCFMFLFAIFSQAQENDFYQVANHASVGIGVGAFNGATIELAVPVTRYASIRAGYNFFPKINISTDLNIQQGKDATKYITILPHKVKVEGKPELSTGHLLVDIYPIKNSEYPSYDIGSSAARWNKLYVKDIDMTGTWEAISAKKINASTVAAAQTTTVAVQGSISKSANASYTSGTTYGYGVQGEANVNGTTDYKYTHNRGVYGYAYGWYADKNIGVYGYSQSPSTAKQANANYGVYASATRGTTAYGIYAEATLGTTNWAGYFKGNVKVEGTVTESSDARLKKDVQTISGALDKVLKLRGISYYWKNMEEMAAAKGVPADSSDYCYDSRKHIGVIAQEIETEFPELVSTDDKGFKSVEYTAIAPILIEAVKELKAEKDALEAKLDKQQAENEAMKARMEKMEKMLEELLKKQ